MKYQFFAEVLIPVDGQKLDGELIIPENAQGVVIFAHGSGSSRLSPRNQIVARKLNEQGIGTLLFDLLTAAEDQGVQNRFNIRLLSDRLVHATHWLRHFAPSAALPFGFFGASTGAAAALVAASALPEIKAVVSRGGRPDLAKTNLARVTAPVLLIVGELDTAVLEWNREALTDLNESSHLVIVPGATHLFEEPGTLEKVAHLASKWFNRHLQNKSALATIKS